MNEQHDALIADIQEILELRDMATPKEWQVGKFRKLASNYFVNLVPERLIIGVTPDNKDDVHFIAAAHSMADLLERALQAIRQMQGDSKDADTKCWLIEYVPHDKETSNRPRWWNGTSSNGLEPAAWTYDAVNALKFFSWAECSVISHALLRSTHKERMPIIGFHEISRHYGTWQPTEHIFSASPAPPAA